MAQSNDYRKWEFFGGYSTLGFDTLSGNTNNARVDAALDGRQNLRGFNLAITRNIHKYVGIKADYSIHFRNDNFTIPAGTGNVDTKVQNFVGGLQFKDNQGEGRWKPFAHAMAGFANQRETVDSPQLSTLFGVNDFSTNETSFAMVFGGGLDIKLNKRIDVRVIQADLNVINRTEQQVGPTTVAVPGAPVGTIYTFPGTTQTNLRLSFGIVIH